MLKRKFRISKKEQIVNILRNGQVIESTNFKIVFIENGLQITRFGILIKKNVYKKAVLRNKFKRIVSEILRLNIERFKAGYDILIVLTNALKPQELNFKVLQPKILSLFETSKILI